MKAWRDWLQQRGRLLADLPGPRYQGPRRVDAEEWRDHLLAQGMRRKSVDTRLIPIRSFYDYLCTEELLEVNPIRNAKLFNAKAHRPTPALSEEELNRLAAVFVDLDPTRRLFASVHSTTVCRVSEALNIRVGDIQRESGPLGGVAHEEGRRAGLRSPRPRRPRHDRGTRRVPRTRRDDLLFSRPGQPPMTYASARFTYDLLGRKAGLVRVVGKYKRWPDRDRVQSIVTPHMLRATGITLLLDKGRAIDRVQTLAGHKMMDTTKLYDRGQGNVRRQVELVSDLAEIIHQG
jgi:integrase